MQKQLVSVLGSTGSIGKNTLDVLARHPDHFGVFALTASTQIDLLFEQVLTHRPVYAVMVSLPHAKRLADKLAAEGVSTKVLAGAEALCTVAADERVTSVMAAIVGAAGLPSCMAAARAGKKLLLANKEALVVGGPFFMDAVSVGGACLLPIDSEHSAVFQSLPDDRSSWSRRVEKIILTASGGPFRTRDVTTLASVTPQEACAHPNWVMGRKISVDSATMMNKALEVIEAKYLFGLDPAQIEVVIHPQSVIHSMVQYHDASVVAQLGTPDMRVPIAYGLSWPERVTSGAPALDFMSLSALTFEKPDARRFPGLQLAWETLDGPAGSTAVLNAANEVAVDAFLTGKIRFDQIHALNDAMLQVSATTGVRTLEDVLALDAQTRVRATTWVASHGV
ncbi:MAG: 1-deoxy-D-xylulose-5-phosphate reductoisomerase [Burkholderiales bacterium]|nr:1-deoxy-D-xylulose-5-phosphate reductoisomerase [Burkholderiales bacterium]